MGRRTYIDGHLGGGVKSQWGVGVNKGTIPGRIASAVLRSLHMQQWIILPGKSDLGLRKSSLVSG